MAWFNVDDMLHGHPKARKAGLEALGLWTVSGSYCNQYLTEGFVPEWFVLSWAGGKKLAAKLVAAGLWAPTPAGSPEPGWIFHDWDHHQRSRAQIQADKEKNRKRQAAYRARNKGEPEDTVGG
jgi:hypothetical protein